MLEGIDPMVWLFCLYGLGLVGIGWIIDLLARHAGSQASRWRRGGFVYHESHDAWLCPQDQWLWPTSFDPENRVMRYRGKPSICNACPVKDTCTTSDHGRSMTREVDQWPHSESGRFHRGLALSVAMMGLVLVLTMMLRYHAPGELAVLCATAAIISACTFPLAVFLWRSPANFPTYLPLRTGEEDQQASAHHRYGASFASSRRAPADSEVRQRAGAGGRGGRAARTISGDRTAAGTRYSPSRVMPSEGENR